MNLDLLENAMIAELALAKANSVMNNLRLVQQELPALRKILLTTANQFFELQRKFREGDVNRKEANREIRDSIVETVREAVANTKSTDPQPAKERNDNLDPEIRFERHELDRFKDSRSSLMLDLAKEGSVLAYAPVLPLCKPYLLTDKLQATGIKFSKFEGYTILDSQLVAGITNEELQVKLMAYSSLKDGLADIVVMSKDAVKSSGNLDVYTAKVQELRSTTLGILAQLKKVPELVVLEKTLLGTKLNSLKPASYDVILGLVHKVCGVIKEMLSYFPERITADSVYAGMIKTASAATGKKLIALGKPCLALGASWLWLMTEKELTMLTRCSLGSHCSITKWGLAFKD